MISNFWTDTPIRFARRVVACTMLSVSTQIWAAHPLITEDTDTQGRGHVQVELNTEHVTTTAQGNHQYSSQTNAVLTYGAIDTLDVIVSVPYLRLGSSAADGTSGTSGLSDVGVGIKWRLFEQGPWSVALVSGASFPTGDDSDNLGAGRTTWNANMVNSLKLDGWAFNLHVGHVHNNNNSNERINLWHASASALYSVTKSVRLIADTGIDTNSQRGSDSNPIFLITGAIWSPRDNLDFDVGYRWERTDTENARVLLAGLTWRH